MEQDLRDRSVILFDAIVPLVRIVPAFLLASHFSSVALGGALAAQRRE